MNINKMVGAIVGKVCWHFPYTDREVMRFEKDLLQYLEEELDDSKEEIERLRKIEAAAKDVFDNCVLYDEKCHICTNTYSYEFSEEHTPECKVKALADALGE